MIRFNQLDVFTLQECLGSYQMLVENLTAEDDFEQSMKDERIKVVKYLIDKCEKVLRGE